MREVRVCTPDGVFEVIVRGDPAACPSVEASDRAVLQLCEVLRVVAEELEVNVALRIPVHFPEQAQ